MPMSTGRSATLPTVDLLVPTKNRHACLQRSLPSWLAALADSGRILLCDQSPEAFRDARVAVLHRPELSGLPAARNVLLAASRAEIVVFLDDDCEIAPDFVAQVRRLAATESYLAWGPVVERRGRATRRLHRLVHLGAFHDPRRLVDGPCDHPTGALFGCCFAVRRAAAAAIGFDARRGGYALGEDLDFFRRLTLRHGRRCARFARVLRAVHRQDGADRADPHRRGVAKGAFLRWLARRHGGGNPATLVHLALALLAAASGRGQEPARWRGVLSGLTARNRR
jgi:glycosyltransferase involved in cell wall biosynthesis